MICTWENVRSHNLRLTWQFPFPSHEEEQGQCFQNAPDPTGAYTSLQQTSFLGYSFVQSSGQTLGMLSLSFLPRINTHQLEHKQSSWEHSAHWRVRELGAMESLPGGKHWDTHSRRGRDRVLKDGSSQHAVYQQGVKRNTETNHGLGCSLHQLLEQHQREAVLQRGWCSSAQPQWDRHSLSSAVLTPSIQTPSYCSRWTLTWKLAFNFHIETAILQLKHNVDKPKFLVKYKDLNHTAIFMKVIIQK